MNFNFSVYSQQLWTCPQLTLARSRLISHVNRLPTRHTQLCFSCFFSRFNLLKLQLEINSTVEFWLHTRHNCRLQTWTFRLSSLTNYSWCFEFDTRLIPLVFRSHSVSQLNQTRQNNLFRLIWIQLHLVCIRLERFSSGSPLDSILTLTQLFVPNVQLQSFYYRFTTHESKFTLFSRSI